jgi:5-methylcytosine-specific restriction endonuclease McrA
MKSNLKIKICGKCKIEKSINEFNKDNSRKDGLQHYCKQCLKQYREDNKDKALEYMKQYREDNKDKIKQYREDNKDKIKQYREDYKEKAKQYYKEWCENNEEYRKEYKKEWYEVNKEKLRESNNERAKKWQKDYPDKIKAHKHKRRARKKLLPDTITGRELIILKEHYKICPYCGVELTEENTHIDHIIPLIYADGLTKKEIESYGEFIGSTRYNLVPCCSNCNRSKHGKYLPEEVKKIQENNVWIFNK